MDSETASRIRRILQNPLQHHDGGIGLSNVAERVYAFFGPESEIELETTVNVGTRFILHLPMPIGEGLEYDNTDDNKEEEYDEIL